MALPHLAAARSVGAPRYTHMRMAKRRLGKPIPDGLRQKMEQLFDFDFTAVRIHENPRVRAIGHAFTHGKNIYLAPGQWNPESRECLEVLGHELAHVVQQAQGRVPHPHGYVSVVRDPQLEAEAEMMGAKAAALVLDVPSGDGDKPVETTAKPLVEPAQTPEQPVASDGSVQPPEPSDEAMASPTQTAEVPTPSGAPATDAHMPEQPSSQAITAE